MRWLVALMLMTGVAAADPTVDTSCGNCSSSAIDGGCSVQPGVGSLASLGVALALAGLRARRGRSAGR